MLTKRELRLINEDNEVKECAINKTIIDYVIECVEELKLNSRLVAIINHMRTYEKMKLPCCLGLIEHSYWKKQRKVKQLVACFRKKNLT